MDVKFNMVSGIKVQVGLNKDGVLVSKLSCDVPANIREIARLLYLAKSNQSISVVFSTPQMALDLKVEEVEVKANLVKPDEKAPVPAEKPKPKEPVAAGA